MQRWSLLVTLAATIGFSSLVGSVSAQTPAAGPNLTGSWNVSATGVHFRNGVYKAAKSTTR